jgi:hypothetical protein
VKKVKKTLKARPGSTAESGAIAVCTKSVLQTKGRTLRKVRCRDKVLETQPMKPQEGGKFMWMGADTPVFDNQAVGEWNGFPVMKVSDPVKFDGWIAKYNPVVRMVSEGDGELPVHKILREMLDKTDPFNQPFVKMHFNLVVNQDAIYEVDYNATLAMVRSQKEAEKTDRLISVGRRFGTDTWFGLVTRTQQSDVVDLDPEPQRDAMCAFLRVLLRIDGRMIHADLHRGNMAIMYDGKPVIHDVGRMKIRFGTDMPGAPQSRFLRNALYSRFDNPNYYMSLSQHFYIARMFKKIRKAYGEVWTKPKPPKWIQDYMKPPEVNEKKFFAWLDAKATGANETNYVQVARVYDILSVLKGLSDLPRRTAAGKPAQLTAYYYARKAAVTLTTYLFAGYATKDNVTRVVRSFLALSGTMDQCGGRPKKPGQTYEDPENEYAALYMTSDGGFKDETRGNPSSAPPPPPPPPPPAAAAPESVDLSQIGATEKALRAQEDKLNQARIESLSGKGDAEAIETLSAIKDVTTTAREVKTAAKNFGKPPEDKAAAPAAEDEAEEAEAEDDFEVGLEVRTADRSAAEKAELAARMEDARLAQGSPDTGGRQEAGGLGGRGAASIAFEAKEGEEPWGFLPPPTDPAAATAAVQAIKPAPSPASIVAYISSDPRLMEKHDIVKNSDYGKAGHALTYEAYYNCKLADLIEAQGVKWVRDEKTRRLRSVDTRFDIQAGDRDAIDLLKDIEWKHGVNKNNVPCLLIPKFKEIVGYLPLNRSIPAIIEILKGLCVPRDFIINDLHMGNMAVMPGPSPDIDGRAVTFDYDKLVMINEFKGLFSDILADQDRYINIMQYDHVMKLGPAKVQEYTMAPDANFFVNYDLLSVLTSLSYMCSQVGARDATAAVDRCMEELTAIQDPRDAAARRRAIDALGTLEQAHRPEGWYLDEHRLPAAEEARIAQTKAIAEPWRVWKEAQDKAKRKLIMPKERKPRGLNLPGGHRTPRRKGLPQLL